MESRYCVREDMVKWVVYFEAVSTVKFYWQLKYFILSKDRMGIINNDVYVCSNGVQKTGTYISFATETIYVVQNYGGMAMPMPGQGSVSTSSGYNVRANYRIFWDQECREAGKSFIDLKSVSTTLTSSQLDSNIYAVLYEELKKIYPNTSDELRVAPVTAAPVTAAPVAPVTAAPVAPVTAAPAESAPAESAPTESAPTESAPVTPAESAPVESAPTESAPVTPAESAPVESAPAPAESAPVTPAESAPVESAPVESAPAESAPVTPAESAPSSV